MSADTSAVRAEEQLDLPALSAYLERESFSRGRKISVEQFPGGHSNLTYLLTLDGGDDYVLRRPPLGPVAPKAHDMVREYRLLCAVHPVFPPAPEPALLCEDTRYAGPVARGGREPATGVRYRQVGRLSRAAAQRLVRTLAALAHSRLAGHGSADGVALGAAAGFH